MNIDEILLHLPHRYPFLLVDRVTQIDEETIHGYKNVTFNEPFFEGHFPGNPILPGVLMIEAMAQLSGILAFSRTGRKPSDGFTYFLAGTDKARFKRPVVPGDKLAMTSTVLSSRLGTVKFDCKAFVDDEVACTAQLLCAEREI